MREKGEEERHDQTTTVGLDIKRVMAPRDEYTTERTIEGERKEGERNEGAVH